jgi:hypothetical protein
METLQSSNSDSDTAQNKQLDQIKIDTTAPDQLQLQIEAAEKKFNITFKPESQMATCLKNILLMIGEKLRAGSEISEDEILILNGELPRDNFQGRC